MPIQQRDLLAAPLTIVVLSALGYYLLFEINGWLFKTLDHSYGVTWIFLPSGLRLALVLIFGSYGALGVMIGSLWAGLAIDKPWIDAALAALISGLAPWAAFWLSQRWFGLLKDLSNLGRGLLIKTAAVFALLSAVSHQALFFSRGLSEDFLTATSVMAVGDLAGTLLVLYGLNWLSSWLGRRSPT